MGDSNKESVQNFQEKWILQIYETRITFLNCIPPLLVSDSGSIWWEAGPFWLPGPLGSSQCHPQANTGEGPGRGRAQWRRIRLGHQLIWDRPRQPGQLPPLTPWTVQESDVRPRTKVKGNIFCFIWSEGGRKKTTESATSTVQLKITDWIHVFLILMLQRDEMLSSLSI